MHNHSQALKYLGSKFFWGRSKNYSGVRSRYSEGSPGGPLLQGRYFRPNARLSPLTNPLRNSPVPDSNSPRSKTLARGERLKRVLNGRKYLPCRSEPPFYLCSKHLEIRKIHIRSTCLGGTIGVRPSFLSPIQKTREQPSREVALTPV